MAENPSSQTLADPDRGSWGSKTEFILSCMGYAIGISNVWRFPYLCYRSGGGAFLVPFLLMLVFCGIPLFFMETVLGQFSATGCITLFRICPLFKGVGFAIIIVNCFTLVYYNVILSYPLYFIAMSMREVLPWETCDHSWNTEHCRPLGSDQINLTQYSKTPADEFFHNGILEISSGINEIGTLVWQLVLCDFVSWIIIFFCIWRGVRSVGKVVYFTATFPYVILFTLLIRGLTLPGAWDGVRYFIVPDWDKLGNLKVWTDAAVQMFFGLGPGWGGIVNMSSFNKFRNNSQIDSIVVPIINVSTSMLAGFVVFSVLGYMSHMTGVPVDKVATGGPGLAFVTYPEALSMMPVPHLWSFLFFFMLYLLGMDSLFVQIECVVSGLTDEFPILRSRRGLVTLGACVVMFLLSLFCVTNGGMYVLQLLDWYSSPVSIVLICTLEVIIVGWIYGINKFVCDLEFMIRRPIYFFWKPSWKYVAPVVLIFILITTMAFNTRITYNGIAYPDWAIVVGWMTSVFSIIWIPIYMVYKLAKTPGTLIERFVTLLKPSAHWGPPNMELRAEWEAYRDTHMSKSK